MHTTYKLEITNAWPATGHENWSDVECNVRASDGSVVGTVGFSDWPGDPDYLHGLPCDKHGDYLFKEEPFFFTEVIFPLQVGTRVADTTPQGVMISVFDYQNGHAAVSDMTQCRPATVEEEEKYWELRRELQALRAEEERYASECDWSI